MRRLIAVLALMAAALVAWAAPAGYATPEAAARALYEAVRSGERAAIARVLGPGSADVVDSGDAVEDRIANVRFVAAYDHSVRIERHGARARLVIGPDAWVVPFPLVRERGAWRFDARAGRDEVIARRVGRNELAAMQAMLAYVDAQREYALDRHDGEGPGVYARRIASRPGLHDGLYWTPTREDPLSPLGVLFSLAAADETGESHGRPYHGYLFRVLEGQGPHAAGGAMDYVLRGRMSAGFALVAYPARHRVSGVRTFIVNHDGVIFSRDLGPGTPRLAHAMRRFDPRPGWRRETAVFVPPGSPESLQRLAGDLGCTFCHREAPSAPGVEEAVPVAPSWREIAARYRGDPRAEETLTAVVIEGADPLERHWKDRLEFVRMGAGAPRVSPDEARALVRSILATR